jgi:hypothetical protein
LGPSPRLIVFCISDARAAQATASLLGDGKAIRYLFFLSASVTVLTARFAREEASCFL